MRRAVLLLPEVGDGIPVLGPAGTKLQMVTRPGLAQPTITMEFPWEEID